MKCVIVGSGMAAILLAERLKEHKPLIIAPETATGPPTALVHPFPGRSIQPHPLLRRAISEMLEQLNEWNRLLPELCRPITMHRPLAGEGGKRLKKSYLKYKNNYADTPLKLNKVSHCVTDGDLLFRSDLAEETLSYQPAFAVDIQTLIKIRLTDLTKFGVQRITQRLTRVVRNKAFVENGEAIEFEHLFLAIGSGWAHFFPNADLNYEGGSLLQTRNLKHTDAFSVNGLHFTANRFNQSVIGSTRWRGKSPTPSECIEQLQNKTSNILQNTNYFDDSTIWRGMRCVFKTDRLPICGRIPNNPCVSVLGALGNKGLLWGPLAAVQLTKNILNKEAISPSLSISRTTVNFTSPFVI